MAHHERVLPDRQLAFAELSGRVDRSELFAVLRALREKGWKPGFKVLCDATGIRELVLRPGDLKVLIQDLKQYLHGNGHQASKQEVGLVVVVVQRPIDYYAAHLCKELAERSGIPIEVCWSRKQAYEYLERSGVSAELQQQA